MTDKMTCYKSGMNKFAQQDFAGALDDLAQAVELDPQFADAYQAMAHCHEKLGDLDQALSAAQKAAEQAPDDFPRPHQPLHVLPAQRHDRRGRTRKGHRRGTTIKN